MVGEAKLTDRQDNPLDFTVADGTGIEKGSLLTLTDPRTAIATTARAAMIAGIAAREKVASDGRTSLAVFRKGVFDMLASGAIVVGQCVESEGNDNQVIIAEGLTSGAAIIGIALETAADGETVQVAVNVGAGAPGQ